MRRPALLLAGAVAGLALAPAGAHTVVCDVAIDFTADATATTRSSRRRAWSRTSAANDVLTADPADRFAAFAAVHGEDSGGSSGSQLDGGIGTT